MKRWKKEDSKLCKRERDRKQEWIAGKKYTCLQAREALRLVALKS
jgi:hypothetical protein